MLAEFTVEGFLQTISFLPKQKNELVKEYVSILTNRLTEQRLSAVAIMDVELAVSTMNILGVKEEHAQLFIDATKRWQDKKGTIS